MDDSAIYTIPLETIISEFRSSTLNDSLKEYINEELTKILEFRNETYTLLIINDYKGDNHVCLELYQKSLLYLLRHFRNQKSMWFKIEERDVRYLQRSLTSKFSIRLKDDFLRLEESPLSL